jgi:DNA sulfur modification protein DndC
VTDQIERAVELTREALETNSDSHWIVGFSGGKDSTAILKLIHAAALKANPCPERIDVIYCDTGVENPILDRYVKALFLRLDEELQPPFRLRVLHAPVTDRFFVKVVGRGYPPPTNSFRWCTSGLRIRPVSRFIRDAALGDAVVALGLRRSESRQRDRSISRAGGEEWQTQIEGGRRYRMFLPILTFDVADVWDAIFTL